MEGFFPFRFIQNQSRLKNINDFWGHLFHADFSFMGIGAFYLIKEELHLDPLVTVNQFLIYYFLFDLIMRLLCRKFRS